MFLKFRSEKFFGLLVLVISLSQISEVSGWDWFNYWSYRLLRWMPWYDQLPWAISDAQALFYEGRRARYTKSVPKPPAKLFELWDIVPVTQPGENADEDETTPSDQEALPGDTRRRYGPFPVSPELDTVPNNMLPRQQGPEVIWEVIVSATLAASEVPGQEAGEVTSAYYYDDKAEFRLPPPPDSIRRLSGPFPLDPEQQLIIL